MLPEVTYDTKKIVIFGIIILMIVAITGFLVYRRIYQPSVPASQRNLFPYDTSTPLPGSNSITEPVPGDNPVRENQLNSATSERLRVIATYPITSMYAFLDNKTITEVKYNETTGQTELIPKTIPSNYVRYNAKQNGFLVDAEIEKNIISIKQRTDTVIPNSAEVWFANQGNTVIFRSWDATQKTITTFSGKLPSQTPLEYCQKPFKNILTIGKKGDEVRELQKYINAKLQLNMAVDGVYGKKIAASITPLQKALALEPTGTYDAPLMMAINTDCTNIAAAHSQQLKQVQKLNGGFISSGIIRGDVSPDGNSIFILKPTPTGVVGIISDTTGKNTRQIFTSPFTEWRPQWVNATTIALTTLASSTADGYLYFLNPITGSFKKVFGPARGLTTLVNPSGTTVLFSQSENRRFSLGTYSVATGETTQRDLATLPAKCTWQNDIVVMCAVPQTITRGQYPDDWYQGKTTFSDSFWSINTSQNSTSNILTPDQQFDVAQLKISPDGNYLYFINKTDGFLWSYRLGE